MWVCKSVVVRRCPPYPPLLPPPPPPLLSPSYIPTSPSRPPLARSMFTSASQPYRRVPSWNIYKPSARAIVVSHWLMTSLRSSGDVLFFPFAKTISITLQWLYFVHVARTRHIYKTYMYIIYLLQTTYYYTYMIYMICAPSTKAQAPSQTNREEPWSWTGHFARLHRLRRSIRCSRSANHQKHKSIYDQLFANCYLIELHETTTEHTIITFDVRAFCIICPWPKLHDASWGYF